MLQVGTKFPDFSLQNQDDIKKSLKDYAGSWLVLYVYPKDDTPGCTTQGKSFTAIKEQFEEEGINIVGVSADDVQSHKNFCNKYSFTIDLFADPDAELLSATGIEQGEWKGNKFWERTTFVVDPGGHLRKIYNKVVPEGHERVVLREVQELKKSATASV